MAMKTQVAHDCLQPFFFLKKSLLLIAQIGKTKTNNIAAKFSMLIRESVNAPLNLIDPLTNLTP